MKTESLIQTGTNNFHHRQERPANRARKAKRQDEFKKILESYFKESPQEALDEFRVVLPRHGRFWDNGYEDIE